MMIVMLRDEVQMIRQPHRSIQPGMRNRDREPRIPQSVNLPHQPFARRAKLRENLFNPTLVMPGLMSFSIRQIRNR